MARHRWRVDGEGTLAGLFTRVFEEKPAVDWRPQRGVVRTVTLRGVVARC
jgi:hypothetical protein